MNRVEQSACILCSRNCGIRVEIDDAGPRAHIVGVRGDEAHPVSHGYLCQKAARLAHYQDHADRLEHPLRRQPDGSFVRVSWAEALGDIARRLVGIRQRHGGKAFAFYGGGGQGNHLGGAYSRQLVKAMQSRFVYSALAQEKTGDFWVNGRLFGDQRCHTTEDVEHTDFLLVIGANPYQAHGIPNARETLRAIKNDPARMLVVVDPRRTETARLADVHLQVRPGTDAFLMAAMLAIIVREGLHDRAFLAARCVGWDQVEAALRAIDVGAFVARADVPLADVERVARGFATAKSACLRIDLGIQQSLHSTLNSYLEKLLFLATGNFGKRGGNNFHSFFLPILGDTDERAGRHVPTAHHGMFPIAGLYPPNILPDEIEHAGDDRVRAVWVDSANPVMTGADTQAYERAFGSLELLVVVDVALTETARLAHYVLPAASQLEKWECTGFNLEFPDNAFHLRHPLFPPRGESLPEAEIYTRLLVAMGEIPDEVPALARIAKHEPALTRHAAFLAAFAATLAARPKWRPFAASIAYRTLGPALQAPRGGGPSPDTRASSPDTRAASPDTRASSPDTRASSPDSRAASPDPRRELVPPAATAPLIALAIDLARRESKAVRAAGHRGNRFTLGIELFRAILDSPQGTLVTRHEYADTWAFLRTPDRRIQLAIPEMLAALHALVDEPVVDASVDYPLVLLAGERRAYNANQIFRDPAWRKTDRDGAMRMHPADASGRGLVDGARAVCKSARGEIEVTIELDDSVRRGMVTLPHGFGMRYRDGAPNGPQINRLTASAHCDPLARTPFHKHVPVQVRASEPSTSGFARTD